MGKILTIVLGAGASHGCLIDGASCIKDAYWHPPLTHDLFNPKYDQFFRLFPKAGALAADLRLELKRDSRFSIETLLKRELEKKHDNHRQAQLRQTPLYFRSLFVTVTN